LVEHPSLATAEFQGFLTGKPRPIEDYAQMVGGKPVRKISKSA
jgi:hypothetical protein